MAIRPLVSLSSWRSTAGLASEAPPSLFHPLPLPNNSSCVIAEDGSPTFQQSLALLD
eukprot:CAMPEP_0119348138 /NCGR_PEP_ID=MMETSP1333-20130426/108887_1 /TAXON_ID=418940 /ORGANISM="Scyphosphaera apsteinii, Strain RCC1455" /LENGTH=56 /DNA_ID=CAMNT_0007360707 /DNA_START=1446 /DNA_END=1619 /DNA_ORIENTATION=+